MPFDWMHATVPKSFKDSESDKAAAMYLAEAQYRAALLRRLGWDQKAALDRIQRNFMWGFERLAPPSFLEQVPEIVARVYKP